MPDCPTCSAYISEQDSVCHACGMDLRSTPPPPPAASPLPRATPSPPAASPLPPASGARLIVKRHGALTTEHFLLGEEKHIIVGRFDPDSGPVDLDLGSLPEAVYVSRHHAELWQEPAGQWMVRDLGSGNGTFVRPQGSQDVRAFQRVTGDQPLHDGDEIALGNARFVLRLG